MLYTTLIFRHRRPGAQDPHHLAERDLALLEQFAGTRHAPHDHIGFHVRAAVNRGATREENLETLGMALYMGPNLRRIARATCLPAVRGRKGNRRRTPRS
jgi:hypothetical protein